MIESLASGLIIAAITGLTFLAYKYPHAYKEISLPSLIFKFGLILSIASLLWNYSISITFSKLSPYIKENEFIAAQENINKINIPNSILLIGIAVFLAAWLYFVFLSILPWLIKKKEE